MRLPVLPILTALLLAGTTASAQRPTPLFDLGQLAEGSTVTVVGRATTLTAPLQETPIRVLLNDGQAVATVIIPREMQGSVPSFNDGQTLTVTGRLVRSPFGSPAVRIDRSEDLSIGGTMARSSGLWVARLNEGASVRTPLAATPAPMRVQVPFEPFPGSISPEAATRDSLNKTVTISGTLAEMRTSPASNVPYVLTFAEGGSAAPQVVFWQDRAVAILGGETPAPGARVSVQGTLSDYRGRLQVRVMDAASIRIEGVSRLMTPTPVPRTNRNDSATTTTAVTLTVAQALATRAGTRDVTVVGEVRSYREPSNDRSPHVLVVGDDGGTIEVVAFPNALDSIPEELRAEGTRIRATGQRNEFRGRAQLQIAGITDLSTETEWRAIVREASDAKVSPLELLERRARLLLKREDGTVRTDYIQRDAVDETVTVRGQLERVVAGEGGRFLVITDDGGQVTAFLNESLVPEATRTGTLAPGIQIEATGSVIFNRQRASVQLRIPSAESLKVVEPAAETPAETPAENP